MNADRLARLYRWVEYAAFGRTLERCRFERLGELAEARRVLVLGEGDGRFVNRLVRENGAARVVIMEASTRMVRVAKQRLGATERVEWRMGDVLAAAWPEGPFDAVVTHFFLDCFREEEARQVVRQASERLTPGGLWVVSEFCEPEAGCRRLHARAWLGVMYLFFRWTTGLRTNRLPDWRGLLERAGFRCVARRQWRWGLVASEVWRRGKTEESREGSRML